MSRQSRSGFTLVELLVVVVLGGLIVLATYEVLITNTRIYEVLNAQIHGQQNLRAGLDLLFGELREVSPEEGDLLAMGSTSITIRTARAFGIACAVDYTVTPAEVTAFRIGSVFESGDSIFIFADNNIQFSADDVWLTKVVQSVDTTATCGTDPGQTLSIIDLAISGDTVRIGAPLRGYDTYTYGLFTIYGEPYLGRQDAGGSSPDPLVGPLLESSGVTFRYLDSNGSVTAVDTLVRQIEVTLRYRSRVRDSQNRLVSDSLMARVFSRN